jgi:hypothetical protein
MKLQMNGKPTLDAIAIGATYTVAAIVISTLLLPLFSLAQSANSNQLVKAQANRPEATAGNITADIKPQGTTLDVENVSSIN